MARWLPPTLANVFAISAICGVIGYMGTDAKSPRVASRAQVEAQAGPTAGPQESPLVSKPKVSGPVAPMKQPPEAKKGSDPAWSPGDPVRVRPDLRRSGTEAPPSPKPGDKQ